MQGKTKVSEGQRRTSVRLVTGWPGILPFSGLKEWERQLTWASTCELIPESSIHWLLSTLCCETGYICLLNTLLTEIFVLIWYFFSFFFFPPWHCSVMSRLKIKTKKNPQQTIFHWASNRFNTDGIFQLPFKHWYTECICRRALLGLDLWGDASLFKIMKNISFYEKPTNPLGRTEAFISKLNCFCPLFLENLQGASRFSVLMFAISTKRKCPSPYFS